MLSSRFFFLVFLLATAVNSRPEFKAEKSTEAVGFRAVMGKHYPAMSVVRAVALMEARPPLG